MEHAKIPLSGKNGKDKYMLVDVEDVPVIAKYKWHLSDTGYALNRSNHTNIRAHRLIMQTPQGMDTDHINGDKLDNRKSNLRICTRSDNLHNKISTGAWLDKRRGTWQVEIRIDGRKEYLGAYKTKQEAMMVYEKRKCEVLGTISRRGKGVR